MDKMMMMIMMVMMIIMMMMMMMAGDLYRDELQGPLLRAEHARAHRAARLQQGISYFYKQTSDKSQKMRLSRGTASEIVIFACKSTTPSSPPAWRPPLLTCPCRASPRSWTGRWSWPWSWAGEPMGARQRVT